VPYLPIASLPYTDRACIDHALGRGAVLLSPFQASFWIGKVYSNMKEINPSVMFIRTRREQIDCGKVSVPRVLQIVPELTHIPLRVTKKCMLSGFIAVIRTCITP
jgi:hypothetical protein